MASAPASPRAKLPEELNVRGTDNIIRISEHAILLTTNKSGGIKLPGDVEAAITHAPSERDQVQENTGPDQYVHAGMGGVAVVEHVREGRPTKTDRVITDEELRVLAGNIEGDWRTLGHCQLNILATDIEAIVQQTSSLLDQRFYMFQRWKTQLGQRATVGELIAAIRGHVEADKWSFLLGEGESNEAGPATDHGELRQDDPPAERFGDDVRSFCSSVDSEDLPPISLASEEAHEGAAEGEDALFQETEAVGQEHHGERQNAPKAKSDVREDIERLSTVFTGFAEDKKDEFTSLGPSLGATMKKILTLDHENKKLKTENKHLRDAVSAAAVDPPQERGRQQKTREPTEDFRGPGDDARYQCESEELKKLKHKYGKLKSHLSEVVKANSEWKPYCDSMRHRHREEMRQKDEMIRDLTGKLEAAQSSSAGVNQQMDSILNATEQQTAGIMNEMKAIKTENKELKRELQKLGEEKRKVEKLSRDLMRGTAPKSPKPAKRSTKREEPPAPHHEQQRGRAQDSYQEVLALAKNHTRAPPRDNPSPPRRSRPKETEATADDDFEYLKQQVLQYRDESERERKDKEKAYSDMESLRKELERAQLIVIQSEGIQYGAGRHGRDVRDKAGVTKKKGFPFNMGPEEVEHFRSNSNGFGNK